MKRQIAGVSILVFCSLTARAAPEELDDVMHLLAARHHGQVSFVEQQFLSLLKKPVESSGELIYDAPNRLEKRTLEPHPESLTLVDNTLTVQRGHRSHVIELTAYPQILPFVESMRATLAGDRGALEHNFRLEFSGSVAHWTLLLVPLDPQVSKSVAQVMIDGARDDLLKVEIRQAGGDRSLMTLRAHPAP